LEQAALPWRALCLFALLLIPCLKLSAADTSWLVADAPFRAALRLKEAPKIADAGILIDLPEFGQTRTDLGDVILVDDKGIVQPLAKIWHGEGGRVLLLAQTLDPEKSYGVYFGGNAVRTSPGWTPKTSLLMETRRLPEGAKIDSWTAMQKTWKSAVEADGAGFVGSIFQGGNPFGPSTNYVTHYSGWLQTGTAGSLVLYTLSSDASFVLVNNQFEFDWPGVHSPWANLKTVHSKEVVCHPEYTEIDYYHAKTTGDAPGAVLGWKKEDKLETIPPEMWLHPGAATVEKITDRRGWPVPIANVEPLTYLGYGSQWYDETRFSVPEPLPEGWNAKWQFEDGATVSGTNFQRVIVGGKSQSVTLTLSGTSGETRGVKRFFFPDSLPAASVNTATDLARYLDLLAHETPPQLSKETLEADLSLLLDFGTEGQAAGFAEAWLQKNPDPRHPLWLPAEIARTRALAQSDARKALDDLKRIDPEARKTTPQPLALLELDLLVFYLQDATAADTAKRVEFLYPNSETERLAKIRAGDFYRLTEQFKQAVEQYQGIQKTIVDETAGRKLPAQDQAYSITIRNLIGKSMRKEAAEKLREWELRHPMAKFDSDFLLLNGRMLIAFGRWNEALTELDSFKKIQSDSPWQVDADFYRAEALSGLGKKDEAKKIWRMIAKDYPKNGLAEKAKKMSNWGNDQ
jgi:TolA-binding protein